MTTVTFSGLTTGQWWLVPSGVTRILVDMAGTSGSAMTGATVGKGGRIGMVVTVTPGNYLYMIADGGGNGGTGLYSGFVGGHYTAIYDVGTTMGTTGTLIAVAGGGGGGSSLGAGAGAAGPGGADGGGTIADDAVDIDANVTGGDGGTQSSGGAGGLYHGTPSGVAGSSMTGGAGGAGGPSGIGGGGGGGGFYGGGGGGNGLGVNGDFYSGPGGGGSSWTNGSLCTAVTHTKGYLAGAGWVRITYASPFPGQALIF